MFGRGWFSRGYKSGEGKRRSEPEEIYRAPGGRELQKIPLRVLPGYGFIPAVKAGGGLIFLPEQADGGTLARDSGVNRKQMHIFYTGNVQGVGFRYTVKTVATGFEVTGTVRNLADGRVELVAQGQKEELEAFRQGIREAGLEHFIAKEEARWNDATGQYRGFEIVS